MPADAHHESPEALTEQTLNLHRANLSLREELEAIDWYQQRADACTDPQLTAVLLHNRDEEVEHAAMLLEWLRRQSPHLDTMLRRYLFSEQPIVNLESDTQPHSAAAPIGETLGIGSMKGR